MYLKKYFQQKADQVHQHNEEKKVFILGTEAL